MYPGYDNYWMYDNRRQEPELYFQKNDYSSHGLAYTDRYKQVQGKGNSNNMYNCAPPPNTVTTSHRDVPNDKHRVTNTQSMLPSPACVQPYPSSLTSQYLPNEVRSAQSNSVPDSYVPLQNQVLRNMQNYNPNQTVNYKSIGDFVNNQKSCYSKSQTSSIRVKDFSLLNNNNKDNNCNSLLVGGSNQSQQKRPWYYLHDSQQNRIFNGQMQKGSNVHGGSVMAEVNYSHQNCASTTSHNYHASNGEQYSQHSAALHEDNAQYERQVCYDSHQEGPEKSSQGFNNSSYPAAKREDSSQMVAQEADAQRKPDAGRQSDNNAYNCNAPNVSEPNEINPASQAQVVTPEAGQKDLQSPSVSTSRTEPTANSKSNNEVPSFRVIVFNVAQNVAIPNNSTEASKNSDFSSAGSNLVSRTFTDCAGDGVNNQKEEFDGSEGNAGSAGSGASQLDQQEASCAKNEENQNLQKETAGVCNTERAVGCIVVPKVENSGLEKGSLEDEKAGCREETKEQKIKSEVDGSGKNKSTEQLSDPEKSELPETEKVKNIDTLPSENPENISETDSTALNDSQQSDVVILDDMVTCIELTEDGDEIDPLEEEASCQSEINRDKLDLLIEFVKEDKGDAAEVITIAEASVSPPPVANPERENPLKKNRRKLSKTSIVRNKNTQREMISLMSYKTPKHSSVRNTLTEEARFVSAKNFDCPKDCCKDKQPEEGPRDEKPGLSVVSEEEEEENRLPTESSHDNCSCYGKGITREERTVINIMRAFQSLKSHFCASCDFTSPVEWIWINIVSGELRCLNCFKKMILKAEENHGSNSKKRGGDGPSKSKATAGRKDEEGGGKRIEESKKSNADGLTTAKEVHRREDLKDRVEEERGMRSENSGDSKKDGGGAADKRKRETHRERTKSTEERFYEKHRKKGGEEAMDSSGGSRKRSNSAEGSVPRKRLVLEEDEGDMRQNKVIRRNRRVSRSRSRDGCSCRKSTTSEEAAEDSQKHESARLRTPNSTEGCAEQKSNKTKEGKAEHEWKRKGHDVLEKPKRKSMTPEEEIELKRTRIKHASEKSKADGEKNKMLEKRIDERGAEKAMKNGELKEQSRNPKNHEKDSNKSEKALSIAEKLKRRKKREKIELRDPPYIPPGKVSAEKRKPSKPYMRSENVESHLGKIEKKKLENSVSKDEDATKHSCQKTAGTWEVKPGDKQHNKSSKQCLISRLFKGKRCLKVNPSGKYREAPKEAHRKEPQREEERRSEKEAKENRCHSQSRLMSFNRIVENGSQVRSKEGRKETKEEEEEESRHGMGKNGGETALVKFSKEDRRESGVGGILEGIVNGTGPKSANGESPLIIRLMKTTTKLSLRLLEET